MDEVEFHDQFRFGKVRLAREKELRSCITGRQDHPNQVSR